MAARYRQAEISPKGGRPEDRDNTFATDQGVSFVQPPWLQPVLYLGSGQRHWQQGRRCGDTELETSRHVRSIAQMITGAA